MPSKPKRDDSLWAKLRAAKELTNTTGMLSDSQVLQIKAWGWIVFQHYDPKKIVIYPDLELRIIAYDLTGKIGKAPKHYAKMIAGLDRSIHDLLGEDWKLVIKQEGKVIYDGPRLNALKTHERRQTGTTRERSK